MTPKAKKNRRRLGQRKPDSYEALKQRARRKFSGEKMTIVDGAVDGVKMSEVLGEFIEPYYELAKTEEHLWKLMALATAAWNIALYPPKDRLSLLEKALQAIPEEAREDGRASVMELVLRKEMFFSNYRRLIVDFALTDTGEGYNLSVASMALSSDGQGT